MSELKLERISHPDAASTSIEIAASGAVSFSNDIAFDTNTFYVDTANGRVGIGTTSPSHPLHVVGLGTAARFERASTSEVLVLLSNNDGSAYISQDAGALIIKTGGDSSGSGSSEAMRIDSSGRLLVGTTSSSITDEGFVVHNNSYIGSTRDSGVTAYFNRLTSDGDILEFRKNNSAVGSIGTASNDLYIGDDSVNLRFRGGSDNIIPATSGGGIRDNAIDLGQSTSRFKDLYLSGGVYVGGTGAANHLDDYEEGTWTPQPLAGATDITNGTPTGTYTKIGNLVYISANIRLNRGSNTGFFTVSGLPFTSGTEGVVSIRGNDFMDLSQGTSKYNISAQTSGTGIAFYIEAMSTGAGLGTSVVQNLFAASTNITFIISAVYQI